MLGYVDPISYLLLDLRCHCSNRISAIGYGICARIQNFIRCTPIGILPYSGTISN
jgi:hypothetical protein